MFSALTLAVAVLATRVESGLYHYSNDIYQHQEPNFQPITQNVPQHQESNYQLLTQNAGNLVNYEVPEKSVSYSISSNDYNYLKQYKNGQQEAQRISYSIAEGAPAVASNMPCKKYQGGYNNGVSNEANYVFSAPTNIANTQNPVYTQPIVKKHFYFHVPAPEVDETPAVVKQIPPPKKTYNILFIKTPSQQYTSNYVNNLQSLLLNNQANVEEKTLIYVLVKKPDPQPEVLVPEPPKSSEHEVFYVKYKDSPGVVATKLRDSLGDTHVDEVASVLNSADVSLAEKRI